MTSTSSPSTAPTWPRQVVFPGQAAAPDGPVDIYMMYVLHHAFRRDLRDFATAVPKTPIGDRARWQAMHHRWELFATALHRHHTGEDEALWPLLLERADDEEVATLEAMEAEHSEIDPILTACHAGFARMVEAPDEDVRAALSVRLTAARESLGRHLAQACKHVATERLGRLKGLKDYHQWIFIDDLWASAHPDLGQSLLRFAARWDVL